MGKRKFALERGGPKRLVVSWGMGWSNLAVDLDGQRVLQAKDKAALEKGATATLPGGGTLRVELLRTAFATELAVSNDGRSVPGTANDPHTLIQTAAAMVFVVAGVTFAFGVAAAVSDLEFLRNLGFGWPAAGVGVGFGVLGWLVRQKASAPALAIAMGVVALDIIATVVVGLTEGQRVSVPGLAMKAFLMMGMARGFRGLDLLKKQQAVAPTSGPGAGD